MTPNRSLDRLVEVFLCVLLDTEDSCHGSWWICLFYNDTHTQGYMGNTTRLYHQITIKPMIKPDSQGISHILPMFFRDPWDINLWFSGAPVVVIQERMPKGSDAWSSAILKVAFWWSQAVRCIIYLWNMCKYIEIDMYIERYIYIYTCTDTYRYRYRY